MTRVVVALLAGLLAFALLFFWGGGRGPEPGTCFGMFGWYAVPCDARITWAAAAVTGVIVFVALWLRERSRA